MLVIFLSVPVPVPDPAVPIFSSRIGVGNCKCQTYQIPGILTGGVALCRITFAHGQIVNFVGVQGEVQEEGQDRDFHERLRKIPLPDELMRDDNDDAGYEM